MKEEPIDYKSLYHIQKGRADHLEAERDNYKEYADDVMVTYEDHMEQKKRLSDMDEKMEALQDFVPAMEKLQRLSYQHKDKTGDPEIRRLLESTNILMDQLLYELKDQ